MNHLVPGLRQTRSKIKHCGSCQLGTWWDIGRYCQRHWVVLNPRVRSVCEDYAKMTKEIRRLIPLSDEEIKAPFLKRGENVIVADLVFGDQSMMRAIRIARPNWNLRGLIIEDDVDVFFVRGVRPVVGSPRRSLLVIRFGDYYAASGTSDCYQIPPFR